MAGIPETGGDRGGVTVRRHARASIECLGIQSADKSRFSHGDHPTRSKANLTAQQRATGSSVASKASSTLQPEIFGRRTQSPPTLTSALSRRAAVFGCA